MKASFAGDALRDVLCDLCDERARAAFTSEAHTDCQNVPGSGTMGALKAVQHVSAFSASASH